MARPSPILQIAIEGEGISPDAVPVRALVELLQATLGTLDAVAREQGVDPPIMHLVAVQKGSARYGLASTSPTAPRVVRGFYQAAKERGAKSAPGVAKALQRLHTAHEGVGALRLIPSKAVGANKAPKPILLAPPIQPAEPLVFEHGAEVLGRVVGLSLRGDEVVVRLRPEDGAADEFAATEQIGDEAARLFGKTVRARVTFEQVGDKRAGRLESVEAWANEDLLTTLRAVREELARDGVRINAAEWLKELEDR